MDAIIGYFVIGAVALMLGIFFASRSGMTVESQWKRAFALAQEIVPALEQLYLTGEIKKEQRLNMAMKELRIHFPDLQEKHLRWAVENAVKLMNNSQLIPLVEDPIDRVVGFLQSGGAN